MNDFQAVVLGAVQGLTEWLPISSTAHLRVVPALAGWSDPGAAFTAVSQLGTLLAAVVYFRRDIVAILTGRSEDGAGSQLLLPILLGTIPVVVGALLFKKMIRSDFRSMWVVAGSMVGFAVLLAIAERLKRTDRTLESVTAKDGLVVGLGQMFALIPGASRSGTTITASLFAGLERATAARFSFLLSLPAVFLAGAYEMLDARKEMSGSLMRPTIVATVAAFIVGLASIDWLMKFLKKHPTTVFIAYRLVVGCGILAMLATGVLKP